MTPTPKGTKMTDRTFTAAELHELLSGEGTAADKVHALYDMIIPILQKRPTMEDMTEEECVACQWMQCDYGGAIRDPQSRGVIGYFDHREEQAIILTTTCGIVWRDYAHITPRPDLPRLEWPGTEKPAPALPEGWKLADHEKYGRVVVTSPAPDADGNVCFVAPVPGFIGNDWHLCKHDELTYLDQ